VGLRLAFQAHETHISSVPEDHPYSFKIAPDLLWATKFRWTILEGGRETRFSMKAFGTYGEAKADVLREIERLARIWRSTHPR
jgi:hypothetical protein